ncbi:hypothetical protein PtB15_14B464 [Puccinia triticina]|nr:hypothetical protein PtB15_14B464 [Puccinia triticina]
MAKSNIPSQNQDDQATKNERDRFRLLHRNLRNCEQSFNDFLKAVGLEKVRQYNDEVFQAVPPASNKLFGLSWARAEAKCILQKQAGRAKIDSSERNNWAPKQAQHKKQPNHRKNLSGKPSAKRRRLSAHLDASAKAEAKCIQHEKHAGQAKIDSLGQNSHAPKQAQTRA